MAQENQFEIEKMTFQEFLLWEKTSRDTIDFKKIYVDMADDLAAGLLLSQIVFWFLPNDKGNSKLRVKKDEVDWLAKGRDQWWDECRLSPKQFDRASDILVKKKLIEKKTYKFYGDPTVHVRILFNDFMIAWAEQLRNPKQNPHAKKSAERAAKRREAQKKKDDSVIPERGKTSSTNVIPETGITESPKGEEEIDLIGKIETPQTGSLISLKQEEENSSNGEMELPDTGISLTETLSENTTEILIETLSENEAETLTKTSSSSFFKTEEEEVNLTHQQVIFMNMCDALEIDSRMRNKMLKQIGSPAEYTAMAIFKAFTKLQERIREINENKREPIGHLPNWFAEVLDNKETWYLMLTADQKRKAKEEAEKEIQELQATGDYPFLSYNWLEAEED